MISPSQKFLNTYNIRINEDYLQIGQHNEIVEDPDTHQIDDTKDMVDDQEGNDNDNEDLKEDDLRMSKQFRVTMQSQARKAAGPPELTFEGSNDDSNYQIQQAQRAKEVQETQDLYMKQLRQAPSGENFIPIDKKYPPNKSPRKYIAV